MTFMAKFDITKHVMGMGMGDFLGGYKLPHATTPDCVHLHPTTSDYIRLHPTTSDYTRLHPTTSDYIRLHPTTSDYM